MDYEKLEDTKELNEKETRIWLAVHYGEDVNYNTGEEWHEALLGWEYRHENSWIYRLAKQKPMIGLHQRAEGYADYQCIQLAPVKSWLKGEVIGYTEIRDIITGSKGNQELAEAILAAIKERAPL